MKEAGLKTHFGRHPGHPAREEANTNEGASNWKVEAGLECRAAHLCQIEALPGVAKLSHSCIKMVF